MQQQLSLYDIYGIWHIPWWQSAVFRWAVLGVLIVLVGSLISYGLYLFIKKKRRISPWQRALREIAELKCKMPDQSSKQFYYALIAIIKRYIHERYGVEIYGKTDHELIIFLAESAYPVELIEPLRTIFADALETKFGNGTVTVARREHHLVLASAIIEKTIPAAT